MFQSVIGRWLAGRGVLTELRAGNANDVFGSLSCSLPRFETLYPHCHSELPVQ